MQRLKDKEHDPSKPHFSNVPLTSSDSSNKPVKGTNEVSMTKPGVVRKISVEELQSPEARQDAWFVVRKEV